MKVCEFCNGRGTLRMFPIPDLTKCFSLPAVDIKTGDNKEKLDTLLTKCQAKHKQNGSKYIGKR